MNFALSSPPHPPPFSLGVGGGGEGRTGPDQTGRLEVAPSDQGPGFARSCEFIFVKSDKDGLQRSRYI